MAIEYEEPFDGRDEALLMKRYRRFLIIPTIESAFGIVIIAWIGIRGIGLSVVQNLVSPVTLLLAGLALALQLLPFAAYFWYFREYRRWKIRTLSLKDLSMQICPGCGYDLHGQTVKKDGRVRCSECGSAWKPKMDDLCVEQRLIKRRFILFLLSNLHLSAIFRIGFFMVFSVAGARFLMTILPTALLFGVAAGAPMMWKNWRAELRQMPDD